MILSSPYSKPDQDVQVLVVTLGEHTMFIPRPDTYEELVHLVQDAFSLGGRPKFAVSSLDICRGKNIEIYPDAYSFMAPYLDEINIVHAAPAAVQADEPRPRGESSGAVASPPTARPIVKTEYPPSRHVTPAPEPAYLRGHREAVEIETTIIQGKGKAKAASVPPAGDSDEFMPSSSSDSSSRTREWEHVDRLEGSGSDGSTTISPEIVEIPRTQQKFKASTRMEVEMSPRRAAAVSPRKQATPARAAAPTAVPPPSQSSDDAERIKVTVKRANSSQQGEFHTRGRHTVKKLLAGACRQFGISPEGARLVLEEVLLDENEEAHTISTVCDMGATLAHAGIYEGAILVVRMRQDEEQDAEEEIDYVE